MIAWPVARGAAICALAVAGLALGLALAPAPAAVADGDPASDVLLVDNVFYPYSQAVSPVYTAALNAAVERAHAAGFPIKVALIESTIDLGAIPQVFGKPEQYAKFLDIEISYNSVAKLLVVMPQGFGTFAAGPVSALSGIRIDAAAHSNGLAAAAVLAIARLAKLAGHPIAVSKVPGLSGAGGPGGPGGSGGGAGAVLAVVAVVAVLLLAGGTLTIRRRHRRSAVAAPASDGSSPSDS